MAQMPNPSVVPLIGTGGYMRPEWVRWFASGAVDEAAALAALRAELLAVIAALEARVAALEAAP